MLEPDASSGEQTRQSRWEREEATKEFAEFQEARRQGLSQRQFARQSGTPRSTPQHWQARKASLDTDPKVAEFLESPSGLAFLHRVVVAAHLVFGQMSPAGIRSLSLFLRLSRLDTVVAASYGSQQMISGLMEKLIVEFGEQERALLAQDMEPKLIVLCEDETFHPGICLVAIEPVSGFILVERYEQKRDATTWSKVIAEALGGLPVRIIQVTSDQAKGIVAHVQNDLGAHQGPDLFHVHNDVSKGVSLPLSRQVKQADNALEKAREQRQKLEAKQDSQPPKAKPSKLLAPSESLKQAREAEAEAEAELKRAAQHQEQMRQAKRGLSEAYHPYRLEDAKPRDAAELEVELTAHFDRMEQVADKASLSQRSGKYIAKARRVLPLMVATLAFFWTRIGLWLATLELEPELERLVREELIAGVYLGLVAKKTTDLDLRERLRHRSEELLKRARAPDRPLGALDPVRKQSIEKVARQCAELFQRSSSCVEGRNGRLELWHRSLHRLSKRKLAALSVLHNYFIKRSDGTTAAERFFGKPPADLFEWLLDRVALPARPAAIRPFVSRRVA